MSAGAELIRLDDPDIAVALRRSARARRFTLTVQPGRPEPVLTVPPRAGRADILSFLARQRPWLRAALARRPLIREVGAGARVPVEGRGRDIRVDPLLVRRCRLEPDALVAPARETGAAVAGFLKERARERLAPELRAAAAALGASMGRLTLRDMRSRWGSCTARGDISLNWRLAMAPAPVAAYVARHEAAHLLEMNHSPAFWALVARLDPDWKASRDWLKREGPGLLSWLF